MEINQLIDRTVHTGEGVTETHIHICSYDSAEVDELNSTDFDSIIPTIKANRINWIQIEGMQDTELIRNVCNHFEIDSLTIQDILNTDHPTKVIEKDNYNVLILKLFIEKDNSFDQQQLSIIHGGNFVLTFLENKSNFFDNVSTAIRNRVPKIRQRQSDYLLSVLLNNVMGNYIYTGSMLEDELEDMEDQLLLIKSEKIKDIGYMIQTARRTHLMLKRAVYPLKNQYVILMRTENKLMHKINQPYFNDISDHFQYVLQTVKSCRKMLSSLVDLYISNNDLRMNDIMKRLTIVSTIFVLLTFLTGVWGMNFDFMPELNWKYGYLFAWGMMILIGIGVYLYIKIKKWY